MKTNKLSLFSALGVLLLTGASLVAMQQQQPVQAAAVTPEEFAKQIKEQVHGLLLAENINNFNPNLNKHNLNKAKQLINRLKPNGVFIDGPLFNELATLYNGARRFYEANKQQAQNNGTITTTTTTTATTPVLAVVPAAQAQQQQVGLFSHVVNLFGGARTSKSMQGQSTSAKQQCVECAALLQLVKQLEESLSSAENEKRTFDKHQAELAGQNDGLAQRLQKTEAEIAGLLVQLRNTELQLNEFQRQAAQQQTVAKRIAEKTLALVRADNQSTADPAVATPTATTTTTTTTTAAKTAVPAPEVGKAPMLMAPCNKQKSGVEDRLAPQTKGNNGWLGWLRGGDKKPAATTTTAVSAKQGAAQKRTTKN